MCASAAPEQGTGMHPLTIAIYGAAGRMGQTLLRVAESIPNTQIVAALARANSTLVGTSIPTLKKPPLLYTEALNPSTQADTLIDFSHPHAFDAALSLAQERRMAFVSGTTGLTPEQYAALEQASTRIPVLWSANFSLGIALLTQLAQEAAQRLPNWDCEILEMHHRHKEDAPSGTALRLGHAIADARGNSLDKTAVFARSGTTGQRPDSAIGFAVMRGGGCVGEHTVLLADEGERIELTHRAYSRDIFARGALTAAAWLVHQAPGRYELADVLKN